MKLLTIKKIVSAGAVLILIGIVGIFFGLPTASALPIRVLDLTDNPHPGPPDPHTAKFANIHGDFINTSVSSLSGVVLSLFDVLYVGEDSDPGAFTPTVKTHISDAISSGMLGLVVEDSSNSVWLSISDILGEPITRRLDYGSIGLTAAGAIHPIFTGLGIPGGGAPVFADLGAEDAFKKIPSGATVLVEDGKGRPVMFTGIFGSGRYFMTGTELTEHDGGTTADSGDIADNLLAHNAIHYVAATTPAPVPEPATVILFGSGMAVLFCYRRFKRKDGDA